MHFAREGNPPGDFFPYLITTFSWHRLSAISLWILVLFLIYVTITACDVAAQIGDGVPVAAHCGDVGGERLPLSRDPGIADEAFFE